jgi:hypothetical protein
MCSLTVYAVAGATVLIKNLLTCCRTRDNYPTFTST